MRRLIYLVSLKSALGRSILHYSQSLLFWQKIIRGLLPFYLWKYSNDVREEAYLTQSTTQNKVNPILARTKVFINSLNSLIPSCINKKCKLNEKIRNRKSINKFKATIFNFIRPKGSSVFDIHDTNGSNLLSRLRLTFYYPNEDKLSHYFTDTLDPIVRCGREPETLSHYLLRGNLYPAEKLEVLNNVCDLNPSLKIYSNEKFLNILLHRFEEFNCNMSRKKLQLHF